MAEMNTAPEQSMGGQFQPQQQQQNTTVIVNQPSAPTNQLLIGPIHGTREWSSGLLDVCNGMGNSVFTFFCYCLTIKDLSRRIGERGLTGCVPAADINIRTRIRTLGGIRGSICDDCIAVTFCKMCAACQEQRELCSMGI
ncbi:cornifelin homolog B-like [Mytilus edulis]|uniref:cornifelin homolog B-like n=1 Tax=Mytilus edulis TaxID=6550 RepID=UPI0039F09ADE